jgi:hypothetical protein
MNAAAPLDIREELGSTPYEHVRWRAAEWAKCTWCCTVPCAKSVF